MHAQEAFGEMALISKETRSATVRAITKTECLQFDQEGFVALLQEDPHFAQRVAQVLTKWLSALGKKTSEDLLGSYRALMFALANLADSRDPETGDHSSAPATTVFFSRRGFRNIRNTRRRYTTALSTASIMYRPCTISGRSRYPMRFF